MENADDKLLKVTRQAGEGDRALGHAEAVYRLMGIMAGGWGHNLEYLRGVEVKLAETLDRVREAIGTAEKAAETSRQEADAQLLADMEALPSYRDWQFTYEYPGYFCYSRPNNNFCYSRQNNNCSVFFTPDWEGDETLPIEVQVDDGRTRDEYSVRLPLPREGRTAQKIFDLVRPTLDKISAQDSVMMGYEAWETALEVSQRMTTNPGVIELTDGSFAGRCDDTLEPTEIDGRSRVRSWAMVPAGLVEVARDDGPAITWHVIDTAKNLSAWPNE